MPRQAKSVLQAAELVRLRPPPTGRIERFDGQSPGLVFRLTAAGAASWSFKYLSKVTRRTERISIGAAGPDGLSLAKAREEASRLRLAIAEGRDPAKSRREQAAVPTFDEAAGRYIEHLERFGKSSWKNDRSYLVRPRAAWRTVPVNAIDRRMIVEVVEAIGKDGFQRTANGVLTALKGFFAWCVDRSALLRDLPASGVRPLFTLKARERVLTPDEIVALWKGTARDGDMHPDKAAVLRLALITGQRGQQLRELRPAEIHDLDGPLPRLAWPAARMKARRIHYIPLAPEALKIVREAQARHPSEVLFGFGKHALSRFAAELQLETNKGTNWTAHDLRRTAISLLAEIGVAWEVREAILAHGGGLRSVYDRSDRHAEMADALRRLERRVLEIAGEIQPHALTSSIVALERPIRKR